MSATEPRGNVIGRRRDDRQAFTFIRPAGSHRTPRKSVAIEYTSSAILKYNISLSGSSVQIEGLSFF